MARLGSPGGHTPERRGAAPSGTSVSILTRKNSGDLPAWQADPQLTFETTIETTGVPGTRAPAAVTGVSAGQMAEDKRFELLRGCPQHAFQACALGH
jgi:hypothetical protein